MVDPNEAIASCSRIKQTQGLLAQLVEHRTFNPPVAGSNPAQPIPPPTNKMESKMTQVPVWNSIDNNRIRTTHESNMTWDAAFSEIDVIGYTRQPWHGRHVWRAHSEIDIDIDRCGNKSVSYRVEISCGDTYTTARDKANYLYDNSGLHMTEASKRKWLNNTAVPDYVLEYCLQVANHASTL